MAANVATLLGECSRLAAESASFGQPGWVSISAQTATANTAGINGIAGVQHFLDRLTLSYSAAPAVSQLQVKDGSTVIWQLEISATGRFDYDFDFSNKPLRTTVAAALTVVVGSAGGAVVQTLCLIGHSDRTTSTVTAA